MLLVSLKCNFSFDPPNHAIWYTLFPFTNRNTEAQRCKEFAQADISKKESSWNQAWVMLALELLPATHPEWGWELSSPSVLGQAVPALQASLGCTIQGALFTEMIEREGSGQRPQEECRLGEGYLTQGEEGRSRGEAA